MIDWEYLNVGQTAALEGQRDWQLVVPEGAVVGAFYVQAINKDAPHPAAARLWQEFLYSDEGQNIWLQGFAGRCAWTPWSRPARSTRRPWRTCRRPRARPCS